MIYLKQKHFQLTGKSIYDNLADPSVDYDKIDAIYNFNNQTISILLSELNNIINFDFGNIPSTTLSAYYENEELLNDYFIKILKSYYEKLEIFKYQCKNFVGVSGDVENYNKGSLDDVTSGSTSGLTINENLDVSSYNNAFAAYLDNTPGIIDYNSDKETPFTAFYQRFFENTFSELSSSIFLFKKNVVNNVYQVNDDQLKETFSFKQKIYGYGGVSFKRAKGDNFKSLCFKSSKQKGNQGYGSISIDYSNDSTETSNIKQESMNFLINCLFNKNHWNDINESFYNLDENNKEIKNPSSFFTSKNDSTIVFWTNSLSSYNDHGIFNFCSKSNKSEKTDNEIYLKADLFGSSSSSYPIEINNEGFRRENDNWLMWSIQFDNEQSSIIKVKGTIYFKDKETNELRTYSLNNFIYKIDKPDEYDYIIKNDNDIRNYLEKPSFEIGHIFTLNSISENSYDHFGFNGYMRNFMIFKGHLTAAEERSLFKRGILSNYVWGTNYNKSKVEELSTETNDTFFLGLVGIYDCTNVIIQNCLTKFNGKTY